MRLYFPQAFDRMADMITTKHLSPRQRLIVALDLPTAQAAVRMATTLSGSVGLFKVGSELFTAEGPGLVRQLVAAGEQVFLDLKFHDIPNTVRAAAREAGRMGVSMLTVHASGGQKMMEAALEGIHAAGSEGRAAPLVMAVTVLTSLSQEDLHQLRITDKMEEAVVRLARLAQASGLPGIIASPRELPALRRACGNEFIIVTPGIRPASAGSNDQARIATPGSAITAGADFLVVGRPITQSADPKASAEAIVSEIASAALPAAHSS